MINYTALRNRPFADIVQTYADKDTILYALGVGLGHDPMDERQLQYVYEKNLRALPTMAAVLGYPGFWVKEPDTGVDWVQVLHGEQSITIHQPLPAAGTVVGKFRVKGIVDKGKGRGALLLQERTVHEQKSGALIRHRRVADVRSRRRRLQRIRRQWAEGRRSGAAAARHAARTVLRFADAAAGGADLPPVRRHQPAACRACSCGRGELSAPDPARPRHLWRGRPRDPAHVLRLRRGQAEIAVGALLGAGVSRRDDPHRS
jgi:hypothetical protein